MKRGVFKMEENERVGRSPLDLKMFKDYPYETDWVFRQKLSMMSSGGAELGECLYVASKIDPCDVESWIKEWHELAAKLEKQGGIALEKGHKCSAREAYLRAWCYFSAAEYGCGGALHPLSHMLWEKSVDCFHKACRLFNPPIQPVEVPFEGKKLPGYFWSPGSAGTKRPTLFAAGGNESSIEQIFMTCGFAAVERGYNFFIFDYPGHRGAVRLYPDQVKRHDQDVPFKAAFDFLQTLPGVDERIALTGFSWGGYVVTRVAAYEKRVKALIPNNPIIDNDEVLQSFYKPIFDMKKTGMPDSRINDVFENKLSESPLQEAMVKYSLWSWGNEKMRMTEFLDLDEVRKSRVSGDELKAISCPVLALLGKNEGKVFEKQTNEFIAAVSSEKKDVHVFTLEKDGCSDHCQIDNRSRSNSVMFDWLDEVFQYSYEKL
jgi:pimeloyl-ACP methyl ester carboxylesterase